MRVTILGGGGFRVPLLFEVLAGSAQELGLDEVVLYDTDPRRLRVMNRIVNELARNRHNSPRVEVIDELPEAVRGADFVLSAIRVGGAAGRIIDERIALRLGVLGQETVGPGGLAYALRTIPTALEVARTVAEFAPTAKVINFTNPAGIVTEAMRLVLGNDVIGVCDTPAGLVQRVGKLLGDPAPDRTEVDYIGLNHLGWLRSFRVDGQDLLPELLADTELLSQLDEARLIGADWIQQAGVVPNEYLFYYLFPQEARSRIEAASTTRGEFVMVQQGSFYSSADEDACCASPLALWRQALQVREDSYPVAQDKTKATPHTPGVGYPDVALQLIKALAGMAPAELILNVANRRADGSQVFAELPGDLVIETPCSVSEQGVAPLPVAPLALGQLGLMAQLRNSEELILQAALHRDREAAWAGFSANPLVDSPILGRQLLDGYELGHPEIAQLFTA